ncbi:sulfatase-like hydrolase/transferase (plasmid) [Tistrella mobilis]|uniref:sulfatase-like hydrolase/transferase n=1 Tax=Tistrella mobilis TaxID=171437 RepID=UPI003557BDFE
MPRVCTFSRHGLPSYTADGAPDPQKMALYRAANRLDPYGFDAWIGPEPHGSNPLNSGSSARDARGRDVACRDEAVATLKALDAAEDDTPWLMVASFVNPHDITLYGLAARLGGGFSFPVGEDVPRDLFDESFKASRFEDLSTKPSAQASYAESYRQWMQPIVDKEFYQRLCYQLQQTVDADLMAVYETLMQSRFADDTIVIFTSDHGDLLDAHGHMHQIWSTPGRPGNPNVNVEDIVTSPVGTPPDTDGTIQWPYDYTVKHQPVAEEYEMYELTSDPLELNNLAGQPQWADRQAQLAALLAEQSAAKRTIPRSGRVPGQPLPIPAGQMG